MSKIAILLPKEYMLEQARNVIREDELDIDILKVIKTSDSVYEARQAVEQGAEVVLARGVQAAFIRQYTNIPVAELTLTGQEIGLMIASAKKKVPDKKCPQIALIGFKNMFSDTTYADELFDIRLKFYDITAIEQAAEKVDLAIQEGADVLLGGDTVNALAAQKGIPAQFIDSTEESIRSAIGVAKKMILTAEAEKNFTAQFETVLDNSYNGILEIDENKEIMIVNRAGEELFHKKASQLEGTALEKVIPELEQRYIDDVLSGKRDSFMTSVYVAGVPMMLTAAPIQYENKIRGAIISLYRNASVRKNDADELHSYYLKGYVAHAHFSDIRITGKEMEYCVELSKMYALSKNPVLICGEDGTDKEKLAQCIHNNSSYKAGPFVAVNCSGMTEQMQVDRLFGNPDAEDESMKKGALAISDHGTIVISEIEKLSLLCQYRLYRAIRYDSLIQNDLERSQTLDNRIIAITGADLYQYVEQGRFRQDLYYLLNSLTVEIPPLRKRPQDIRAIVEDCRVRFTKRYARFPKIAEDAMEALAGFGWQGNEIQLESFCERLFLTSPKKTITSDYVYFLLDTLYPVKERISEDGTTVIYQHPEAARLTELLEKHQGNRSAVAKELGISTTTLWRRMKKYGVINKYDLT
ncbi:MULTISPECIES: sigma 54-interacting transcriptional regulator [Blautia]|jgi:transcriptional regulator with PAS, ATPase and Fis domain|uniref:Sigma 54-interacting transcriptional regulator n=1 Tax=Blautia intestinihominis TaxID=3133152 RepID=A0ABV1AHQ2_9FIRM|nr:MULTISPECIES: sigma 54-interacting transcriptional regulator [unclassified Blautia]RHV00792.1 PAS domain-containing protein [Blautia sp. OM07-19]RHV06520.1 PAS domain-containing protein [Blautia sp. OM07-19]